MQSLMRSLAALALAAVLMTALGAPAARSDEAADRETCFKSSGDKAIAACTRRIASLTGKTDKNSRHNLAVVHYSRGYEFLAKTDDKRALADFEVSWKTDPSYTQALYARGLAKKRLGDEKAGDADMAQAKKIDPKLGK